jgi:hypothetical protein
VASFYRSRSLAMAMAVLFAGTAGFISWHVLKPYGDWRYLALPIAAVFGLITFVCAYRYGVRFGEGDGRDSLSGDGGNDGGGGDGGGGNGGD